MDWRVLDYAHTVKVRKPRFCEWCKRTWPKGSRVWTWAGASNGGAVRVYMCLVCFDYMNALPASMYRNGLPDFPFWEADPDRYDEFDAKHCIDLLVAQLMSLREMRDRGLEWVGVWRSRKKICARK